MSLHGFGHTADGQLGFQTDQFPTSPTRIPLQDLCIQMVAGGDNHSLFLTNDGTVYATGSNTYGQLGVDSRVTDDDGPSRSSAGKVVTEPVKVRLMNVVYVACGLEHSAAILANGTLYTWGSNKYGQLGIRMFSNNSTHSHTPLKVELSEVAQVACGRHHTLTLTRDGNLHAFGRNCVGQLGNGERSYEMLPCTISSLRGVPIGKISAGGEHSVAVSTGGAVFAWGGNDHGQIGNGTLTKSSYPIHIKTLRNHGVVDVECGDDHSVALTKDGQVFSWGADTFGQCGHGKQEHHEPLPRIVIELAGSVVVRIAVGRCHSLALLDNGRLHSWGLNSSGQLGLDHRANRLTPAPIPFAAVPSALFASGDRSWILMDSQEKEEDVTLLSDGDGGVVNGHAAVEQNGGGQRPGKQMIPMPSCLSGYDSQIHSITTAKILALIKGKRDVFLLRELEHVLSDVACVNNSFLSFQPGVNPTAANARDHGVDMDSLMDLHEHIETTLTSASLRNQINSTIRQSLGWGLIPILTTAWEPPDIEALRVYLMLPWLTAFDDPKNYPQIQVPFARAFNRLGKNGRIVIEKWYAQIATRHFNRVLKTYRSLVDHLLKSERSNSNQIREYEDALEASLNVMQLLNHVNNQTQKVSFDAFYIHDLHKKMDVGGDYFSKLSGAQFALSHFPFIFNAEAKSILLQTDAGIAMRHQYNLTQQRNMQQVLQPLFTPGQAAPEPEDIESPFLGLVVRRDYIVEDTISNLVTAVSVNPITFADEEGQDDGGLQKEYFMILCQEILHPKYGMFFEHPESRYSWFNTEFYQDVQMYKLVGLTIGLAIYNGVLLNMNMPITLFKKLLDQPLSLDDLKELSPTEGKSLESLLEYQGEDVAEAFCLTFEMSMRSEITGQVTSYQLKEGGSEIMVTAENRQEFVQLYIEQVLNKSISEQFKAFREGFFMVFASGGVIELFQPAELMELLTGNDQYDWYEFEKNTVYKGDYYRHHETIELFWTVFHDFNLTQKKQFLKFLSGCDRIPVTGMSSVKMIIQPVQGGTDFWPVAHTCLNLLDLPRYKDVQSLRYKLSEAIQYNTGFNLV